MSRDFGHWALGLIIGAVCALAIAVAGATALVLAMVVVGLALARWTSLALLSGACIALGGTWTGLVVRAQLACDAFDAAPNQSCTGQGVLPFTVASVVLVLVGVVVGGISWWRRAAGPGLGGRSRHRQH